MRDLWWCDNDHKLKLKTRHICICLVVSAHRTLIPPTSKVPAASLRSLWQLSLERASPPHMAAGTISFLMPYRPQDISMSSLLYQALPGREPAVYRLAYVWHRAEVDSACTQWLCNA